MTSSAPAGDAGNRPAWEWPLLAALVILGAGLRWWSLSAAHVEHFDEGVYASNLCFTEEEGARYPLRHLYAPPLWPAVLETSQLWGGRDAIGVLLPGVFCGTLAILLVWRLARDWAGPLPGIIAAALAAVSPLHTFFSRTALTDVPMTACLLAALWCGWRGLADRRIGWGIAAGLLTGIAWSLKYNGWFPVAVTGAALLVRTAFHVKRLGPPWKEWAVWGLMAGAAAVAWYPAWRDLQEPGRGGYAAVVENQQRYVEGFTLWLPNLQQQIANVAWYDHRLAGLGYGLLCGVLAVLAWQAARSGSGGETSKGPASRDGFWVAGLLALLAVGLATSFLPAVHVLAGLALFGVGCRVGEALFRQQGEGFDLRRCYSAWMAAAWLGSLVLVTPLYHPYPRLVLPLLIALWLGTALAAEQLLQVVRQPVGVIRGSHRHRVLWGVVCLAAAAILPRPGRLPEWAGSTWQERLSASAAADEIANLCSADAGPGPELIYVYGEPALLYHLYWKTADDVAVRPVADLGFTTDAYQAGRVPTYLVLDRADVDDDKFLAQWEQVEELLPLLHDVTVQPSDLVQLNEAPPDALAGMAERPDKRISVYRLRSAGDVPGE